MTEIYEDVTPNAEFLIRASSEQGYSLEAALADLIDNSISAQATKVELLVDTEEESFTLYVADNGNGMTNIELANAMKFPSQSPENRRQPNDLGRFGLGMKTASFSQTRKFTVLSKKNNDQEYCARTWDLKALKDGGWRVIVNPKKDIATVISKYKKISSDSFLGSFENFKPNTIVIWHGLHKFEEFISERDTKQTLYKELLEVTSEHLSIAFHRFMERTDRPISIRLNHKILEPFNPLPSDARDFRGLGPLSRTFNNGDFSFEGFILPSRAISESRSHSQWTTKNRSLLDMEGMYVYRSDRLISFGGWHNLSQRTARHSLARLKVNIGNNSDSHLHLNVAKSQVRIPDDLRLTLKGYIATLKEEAAREYNNKSVPDPNLKRERNQDLLSIVQTTKGAIFEVNQNFPLFRSATEGLGKLQKSSVKALLRLLTVKLNHMKDSFEPELFSTEIADDGQITEEELLVIASKLFDSGLSKSAILKNIMPGFGFKPSSLPKSVMQYLE